MKTVNVQTSLDKVSGVQNLEHKMKYNILISNL